MAGAGYWLMSYNPAYYPGWWLGGVYDSDGRHIDDRVFLRGQRLCGAGDPVLPLYPFGEQKAAVRLPLQVPVERAGQPTDFGLAGGGAPVVSDQLGQVFRDHAAGDVELLPAAVGGEAEASHAVLNVTRAVDAIDWARSAVDWGPAGAPGGWPYYVSRLVIREDAVAGLGCFRAAGWQSNFIVSAALLQGIRELGPPGDPVRAGLTCAMCRREGVRLPSRTPRCSRPPAHPRFSAAAADRSVIPMPASAELVVRLCSGWEPAHPARNLPVGDPPCDHRRGVR